MPAGPTVPALPPLWTPAATLPPSIEAIQALICIRFGISISQLCSGRRDLAAARQAGMYLARRAGHQLDTIGRHFGGLHHTTVSYAARHVDRLMRERPVEWGTLMVVLAAEAGGMGSRLVMPGRDR